MTEFRKFCMGALIGSSVFQVMIYFGLTKAEAEATPKLAIAWVMVCFGLTAVAAFGNSQDD